MSKKPLGSKISVLSGFAFPSSGFTTEEGMPLVRIRDITNGKAEINYSGPYPEEYEVENGDLLIGMDGDFNVVRWKGSKALLNQRVCKIKSSSVELSQDFLFWYLIPHVSKIHRVTPQTTVKHLSTKSLYQIPVPQFVYEEQKFIANILDTLDTQIRQTEAIIAKLQQVKQGLLHDLLTRGIDESGQLRPPYEQAPELYKESPLGWIPKEWEPVTLKEVYKEPSKNGLYKPAAYHGRGPLMVQMGNIFSDDSIDYKGASKVDVSRIELESYGLCIGDLLFARRSLVMEGAGKVCFVDMVPSPATFESSIIRVRVQETELIPEFVAIFLQSNISFKDRRKFIRQVAVSGVSSSDVGDFSCIKPEIDEQRLIVEKVRSIWKRIKEEKRRVKKLKKQKAGLMDDLLTGRIRVTELIEQEQQAS